jgi:hypothetical protein
MGHENRDMGTRYAKQLIENIEWRKEWAEEGRPRIQAAEPSTRN